MNAAGRPPANRPTIRRARTSDVPAIKRLVDTYAGKILLEKNLVTLYEAIQEFWVAEHGGNEGMEVVGCGALHVLWSDLGEVRTVAVAPELTGQGIGHAIVDKLLDVARELQLQRLFVLTFETEFFGKHGFTEIEGTPVTAEVYDEMRRSYDIGVAEFLDLSYVKPNILGNSRMLLVL
ncbi:MAG TPA: amino-acid N-acetyltransferase [Mycobacterium sp.]|nr:amino-acid N-acetyltransferase [Mycobacterium sp.]